MNGDEITKLYVCVRSGCTSFCAMFNDNGFFPLPCALSHGLAWLAYPLARYIKTPRALPPPKSSA